MNFIHTADIHLDASYSGAGMPPGFGNRRRQALRDVFHDILLRAKEWPADAVLIPGDLFEHDRVTRDTIAFLKDEFQAIAPIPVIIAPGNHDPCLPDSPYATETWPENVHIFTEARWATLEFYDPDFVCHGFAFDGYQISHNPLGELEVPDDGRVHLALGHGSERNRIPAGQKEYAPFDAAELAQDNLDYAALGHFHITMDVSGDYGTRMFYSGVPEGHDFGETGLANYLEVEITTVKDKRRVLVKHVPICRSVYLSETINCEEYDNAQKLVEKLRALADDPDHALIARVTLKGSVPPALKSEFDAVYDSVAEHFEYLLLNDETQTEEDYEALAEETTSRGLFVQRLNEEIEDAPEERLPMLLRAREVGVAAYRGHDLPIRGLQGGAR